MGQARPLEPGPWDRAQGSPGPGAAAGGLGSCKVYVCGMYICMTVYVYICLLLFGAIWCYLLLYVDIPRPYLVLFVDISKQIRLPVMVTKLHAH